MLFPTLTTTITYKWVVKVRVAQSCPTLCDPTDHTVYGILRARILEWVAIPVSRGSSQPRDGTCIFCVADGLFNTEPPGIPQ